MDLNDFAEMAPGIAGALAGLLVLVDIYTHGAIFELIATLLDAWHAADLRGRLRAWWYVVTHRHLVDGPPPEEGRDAA